MILTFSYVIIDKVMICAVIDTNNGYYRAIVAKIIKLVRISMIELIKDSTNSI